MHRLVAKLIGFDRVQRVMQENPDAYGFDFVNLICDEFKISFQIKNELKNQPRSTIFFANHHAGAVDFLAIFKALENDVPNLKILVNRQLMDLKPVARVAIASNPPSSPKDNMQTREEIRQHLEDGGNLVVFPAGRVASKINGVIVDSEWRKGIFDLYRDYAIAGVPVFIGSDNGKLFYFIRSIFPKLSMIFLMRCLNASSNKKIKVFIGRTTPKYLLHSYSSLEIMQFYRNRVYELKNRGLLYESHITRDFRRENGGVLAGNFQ